MRPIASVMILLLPWMTGCGNVEREAAEILNSATHKVDLRTSEQASLPNDLRSGECRNGVGEGKLTWAGPVSSVANLAMTADIALGDGTKLNCKLNVSYSTSDDRTGLLGGGEITNCDGFECSIHGHALSCDALGKALKTYTCATVSTF